MRAARLRRRFALACGAATIAAAFAFACSSAEAPVTPAAVAEAAAEDRVAPEAAAEDAGTDARLTGECADAFGASLTESFGRIDGIVYAVQKPSDTSCAMPNDDHVVVQVLMNGEVYRLVVNVQSGRNGSDPRIRYAAIPRAMPEPAYEEGWHTGIPLDYVNVLGIHSEDAGFAPLTLAEAVAKIDGELVVGDPVAVYATSGAGRPESAHLVHRNKQNEDGAIVVRPGSADAKFLLFHFAEQSF